MSSDPLEVYCTNVWGSPLSAEILYAFAEWGAKVKHDKIQGDVEVEVRLGKLNPKNGSAPSRARSSSTGFDDFEESSGGGRGGNLKFEPGVSDKFFGKLAHYLMMKGVPRTETDLLDCLFDGGYRVTLEIVWDNAWRPKTIKVKDVIIKSALTSQINFKIHESAFGYDMRLGVASEVSLKEENPDYKVYAKAAREAVEIAFSLSDEMKLHFGAAFRIKESVKAGKTFKLTLPFDFQIETSRTMYEADPLYQAIIKGGGSIDGQSNVDMALVRQLQWMLLQPSDLPLLEPDWENRKCTNGLRNIPNGSGQDNPSCYYITNVPGSIIYTNDQGVEVTFAVPNAEYIGKLPSISLMEVVPESRFVGAVDPNALAPRLYRRKKRSSYKMDFADRGPMNIDLTSIQQTENVTAIFTMQKRREVEIEQVLNHAMRTQKLGAVHCGKGMVHDIHKYLLLESLTTEQIAQGTKPEAWRLQKEFDLNQFSLPNDTYEKCCEQLKCILPEHRAGAGAGGGTDQNQASSFYNQLTRTKDSRASSMILHMRNLNNWIKSTLIQITIDQVCAKKAEQQQVGGSVSVLDLACGKGPDTSKFKNAMRNHHNFRISKYVGSDIAKQSLEEAIVRAKDQNHMNDFPMRYIAADLGANPLSAPPDGEPESEVHEELLDQWNSNSQRWEQKAVADTLKADEVFDIVSMQFAFHYMFHSENTATRFFKTIKQHMRIGSQFIATTVNAHVLVQKLLETSGNVISFKDDNGVETCQIRFDEDTVTRLFDKGYNTHPENIKMENNENESKLSNESGLRYHFRLFDNANTDEKAVDVPEYLISPVLLEKMATRHGFKIVLNQSFGDFVHQQKQKAGPYKKLIQMKCVNVKGTLSQVEWDICNLYSVLIFERVAPPPEPTIGIVLDYLKHNRPGYEYMSSDEKQILINGMLGEMRREWALATAED